MPEPQTGGSTGTVPAGPGFSPLGSRVVLALACLLILAIYASLVGLKGADSDEGIRLGIINGGQPFLPHPPAHYPDWDQVLRTGATFAYQPLYLLLQNTLMRVAHTQSMAFFRFVNLGFLWICLQGLLALSRGWSLPARLFLLGVFSLNAYLIMHVVHIREYIVGIAFYIWSTWLVLKLDRRKLERPWADVAWFTAYAVLLILGFYVQSWVVFPAIAQGLFLVVRRDPARWRFYAHLALTYLIVLCFTWPYLRSHREKIDVGRWGDAAASMRTDLKNGFSLVFSGHLYRGLVPDLLCWFWPALTVGAAIILLRRKVPAGREQQARGELLRQGGLMLLCSGLSLAFQIGYFLKVDTLSLWPRYFAIHYFFLFWLVALAFHYLWDLRSSPGLTALFRHSVAAAVGVSFAVMLASGIYQVRSFRNDPYLDSGLSATDNWNLLADGLSRLLQPRDAVLTYNFISSATLTISRPLTNPVVLLQDLETAELRSADRLVYLESYYVTSERAALAARLAALGFPAMQELPLRSATGQEIMPIWRVLI